MSQNCVIVQYATNPELSQHSLLRFLAANGCVIEGDFERETYAYFRLHNNRFRVEVDPFSGMAADDAQQKFLPRGIVKTLSWHFDRAGFGELLALLQKSLTIFGGVVIEGLDDDVIAYDAVAIMELRA